jgi:hypothetical protein
MFEWYQNDKLIQRYGLLFFLFFFFWSIVSFC